MFIAAQILVALNALIHIYIVVLEMVLWTKPAGMKAFNLDPAFAERTKVLGANQGLYNGFLAAGLILGLAFTLNFPGAVAAPGTLNGKGIEALFLAFVLVAGLYGAATASRKILFVQAVPATLALIALALA
jgi:putative membrane protein